MDASLNNQKKQPQEVWREIPEFTKGVRVFVSNNGRFRMVPELVQDPETGRLVIYVAGRPVFADSVVLSAFGSEEQARMRGNSMSISYSDVSFGNISASNLSWERQRSFKRSSKQDIEHYDYVSSRTLTPDMIASRQYESIFDNSESSVGRPAEDEKFGKILTSPNADDKRPDDTVPLSSSLEETIDRPDITGSSNDYKPIINSMLQMIRMQRETIEDTRKINDNLKKSMDEIVRHEREVLDTHNELKKQAIKDIRVEVLKVGKRIEPNVTNAVRHAIEVYRKELDDIAGYDRSIIETLFNEIQIPDGYSIMRNTGPDGRTHYFKVSDKAFELYKDIRDAVIDGTGWRNVIHPTITEKKYVEIKKKYGAMGDMDDFYEHQAILEDGELPEEIGKDDEDTEFPEMNEPVTMLSDKNRIREAISRKAYDENKTEKQKEEKITKIIKENPELISEITSELTKITRKEWKELGLMSGDKVQLNTTGTPGKPVVVTDVRTMREYYVPSMKAAAEMLGCQYFNIQECVWGRRRQIGYYTVAFYNVGDAVHVMSGIYKRYMELIESKRAEVMEMDDNGFKELSRQLEEIEKEMEK